MRTAASPRTPASYTSSPKGAERRPARSRLLSRSVRDRGPRRAGLARRSDPGSAEHRDVHRVPPGTPAGTPPLALGDVAEAQRRDDTTGDLWRFVAYLQEVADLLLSDCDRFPDLFDFERAPEPFLDALLTDLGNPFPLGLNVLGRPAESGMRRGSSLSSRFRCARTPPKRWCSSRACSVRIGCSGA
jgi:hypothetical protein